MIANDVSAHAGLAEALLRLTGGQLIESDETGWSCATFSGARHRFVVRLTDRAARERLGTLRSRQFRLPGHIVVDVALLRPGQNERQAALTIEALTVRDN